MATLAETTTNEKLVEHLLSAERINGPSSDDIANVSDPEI